MIKQTDLSKLPVRFIAPDPYIGTPLKLVVCLIFLPASFLVAWTALLHLGFSLSGALSAGLDADIELPRSNFWNVWMWPAPVIVVASIALGLWPTRVRISPSEVEVSKLPFLGRYKTPISSAAYILCLPGRLEMGPFRNLGRIYEVVVLELKDGSAITLGYSTLPGDAYAYAREAANQLSIPCLQGLPDEDQEAPIYFSRNHRFNPDFIDSTDNTEEVPKGLELKAGDDHNLFRSFRAKRSRAQAVIVAAFPIGLMLLWHFSGGVWWISLALGLSGILVLAWHYYNTRTFAADTLIIKSDSISFSKGKTEADEIQLSSIQDVFLSSPGYRFPPAIIVSTDDRNHYFSGGLFTEELMWVGRHISELLRKRREISTTSS